MVLVSKESPDHGNVLNDNIEWYSGERSDDEENEADRAHSMKREGFDHTEDVVVNIRGEGEGTEEVNKWSTWNGGQDGEDYVRRRQRKCDPRVERDR